MRRTVGRLALVLSTAIVLWAAAAPAMADPKDETQVRTMVCDNGETVEAIIHRPNTLALHVTTDNRIFVIKYIERDGEIIIPVRPGFDLDELVNCETVEFDLTIAGFFTGGP